MRGAKTSTRLRITLTVMAVTLFVAGRHASAQQEAILAALNDQNGVGYPRANLLFNAGNLYGTASQDGAYDFGGAVFALTPDGRGGWQLSVLHNFQGNGQGGYTPFASLIADRSGNLYGTTVYGGDLTACSGPGCGVVFELSPHSDGSWTEKVLHTFIGKDGAGPFGNLIFDTHGNLYGTTASGAAQGCGTVFELTHKPSSSIWIAETLHSFTGPDGCSSYAGLIFDFVGNLYGTTSGGGTSSNGTVFKLTPFANGSWTETVLHNFTNDGADGYNPRSSLVFDPQGNLYGTTLSGGAAGPSCASGCGTVFQLMPQPGGWAETILHSFINNGTDGWWPISGLILDSFGNLYGTTQYGGNALGNYGTVFELMPANNSWTERILHNFDDNGVDGLLPNASLILHAGSLYGTTYSGGAGYGTVFDITP